MKKVFFIGMLFGGLALTSCKKDYTCECTETSGGSSTSVTINDTKSNAEEECDSGSSTTTSGVNATSTCIIL